MIEFPASGRVYTNNLLSVYDWGVHSLSNHFIWNCPTHHLIDFYATHISTCHLDIGVATGYLLDRSVFPVSYPYLTLVDVNPYCLRYAARRLSRYRPSVVQGDVMHLPFTPGSFGSIGLGYLLHCLPGSMREKGVVFDYLRPLIKEQGVIFGTTVLGAGMRQSQITQHLLAFYNRVGVFSNDDDDANALESILRTTFGHYSLEVIGSVALFAGYVGYT